MFEKVNYGFWKQTNPSAFLYDMKYKGNQSTNIQMVYLRLGWLFSNFSYDQIKNMKVVDIGSGNGIFAKECKNIFKQISEFDLDGVSISNDELESTNWDLIIMTDVLEHFIDIDYIFKLKWKHALISFPETPKFDSLKNLKKWKHFKPDEHIWCLNLYGVNCWLEDNDCCIVNANNIEDIIRHRYDEKLPNISSIIVKNNNYD